MGLVVGGGAIYGEGGKLVPLSQKAKHIVQHMFSEFGRTQSEIWTFLADEADWENRVAAPKRAAAIFLQPTMSYAVRQAGPRPTVVSSAERRFAPNGQRSRKKAFASASGRH